MLNVCFFFFANKRESCCVYQQRFMSLPMDATKEDIKKQYRRLCLQWHPDKSEGGRERFEQLQVAHTFLTDDAQREEYDFGIWKDRPARHHTKKRDKVKDSWKEKDTNEDDAPRNHYNWGDRHLIEDDKVESIYWGQEGCPAWLREKRKEYQRKHFGEDYIVSWDPSLPFSHRTGKAVKDKSICRSLPPPKINSFAVLSPRIPRVVASIWHSTQHFEQLHLLLGCRTCETGLT